jgi:hypothetical protein
MRYLPVTPRNYSTAAFGNLFEYSPIIATLLFYYHAWTLSPPRWLGSFSTLKTPAEKPPYLSAESGLVS